MAIEKILVPDIGGAEADVIEVLVKVGDNVALEDSLVTLEGEKATMDLPAPLSGVIQSIAVSVGDKLSEGQVIGTIETEQAQASGAEQSVKSSSPAEAPVADTAHVVEHDLLIPDLGDAAKVEVIEVLVKPSDSVDKEQPLITLEGDKATMDVPSLYAGKITVLTVAVGSKVGSGDIIGKIEVISDSVQSVPQAAAASPTPAPIKTAASKPSQDSHVNDAFSFGTEVHAGPAVRRIAREFGVNLKKIKPTGLKQRITKEDVQQYVKQQLQRAETGGGAGLQLLPMPSVDFSKYGAVTTEPLSKIKKISGANLHRNWVSIPHVTQ